MRGEAKLPDDASDSVRSALAAKLHAFPAQWRLRSLQLLATRETVPPLPTARFALQSLPPSLQRSILGFVRVDSLRSLMWTSKGMLAIALEHLRLMRSFRCQPLDLDEESSGLDAFCLARHCRRLRELDCHLCHWSFHHPDTCSGRGCFDDRQIDAAIALLPSVVALNRGTLRRVSRTGHLASAALLRALASCPLLTHFTAEGLSLHYQQDWPPPDDWDAGFERDLLALVAACPLLTDLDVADRHLSEEHRTLVLTAGVCPPVVLEAAPVLTSSVVLWLHPAPPLQSLRIAASVYSGGRLLAAGCCQSLTSLELECRLEKRVCVCAPLRAVPACSVVCICRADSGFGGARSHVPEQARIPQAWR